MSDSQNGKCGCGVDYDKMVAAVQKLEDMLEGLHDLILENHQETLETIQDVVDRGEGFSTVTFES